MQTGNYHALKHGLARSIRCDPGYEAIVDELAKLLAGPDATWFRTFKATRLAEAVAVIHRLATTEVAIVMTALLV